MSTEHNLAAVLAGKVFRNCNSSLWR